MGKQRKSVRKKVRTGDEKRSKVASSKNKAYKAKNKFNTTLGLLANTGGTIGGTVGFAAGGPVGAMIGGSVGGTIGVETGKLIMKYKPTEADMKARKNKRKAKKRGNAPY